MELSTDNINWVISAVVGIFSSVIGAFIFWGFQKFSAGRSTKKRAQKLDDLKKQKEKYKRLHESTPELLIHYFGILFYILFISFLSSTIGYLGSILYFLDLPINITRIGLYLGAALLAVKAFSDLAKLKMYEETIRNIDKELESLEEKQP